MSGIHIKESILVAWNLCRSSRCKYCDDSLQSLPVDAENIILRNCYVVT